MAEVCTDRPCLILVQSFSASIFSRIYALIISDTNFYQFGHIYIILFKWPRQEAKTKQQQNKTTFTATRGQECSPTNRRQPTKLFFCALSQGLCADWLVCIVYCIFWHLIGSDQLSYFF